MTVTDKLRKQFGHVIEKIAASVVKTGITANQLTIMGFFGNILAAGIIASGNLVIGGVVAGISCLVDALDGAVARVSGLSSSYGSLLDSTLDRYSETALYLGLLFFYLIFQNRMGIIFIFLAFSGSILVSYIRARSEGLGINIEKGLLTRVERMIVLILSLLLTSPIYGLIIIAVLGHLTAVQRFFIAKKILTGKDTG